MMEQSIVWGINPTRATRPTIGIVSGNVGAYPPTGSLSRPAAGATVANGTNPLMDVTATTSDDVRVTAVRLVAKINNQWVEIGPLVTQPSQSNQYDWDVNLCAVGPLNGPLEVALRVWDHEGNVAAALGPRTIQVDHACPPPTSQLYPAEGFNSTAMRLSWDAVGAEGGLGSFELQWRYRAGSMGCGQHTHLSEQPTFNLAGRSVGRSHTPSACALSDNERSTGALARQ